MKKPNKLRIEPAAVEERYNCEHGTAGYAAECINLREREEGVAVTGNPNYLFEMPAGYKMLIADKRDSVTFYIATNEKQIIMYAMQHENENVMITDTEICQTAAIAKQAVKIGEFVVVSTGEGLQYLYFERGEYFLISTEDMIPQISFTAGEVNTSSKVLNAFNFSGAYTQWKSPLVDEDIKTIQSSLSKAFESLKYQAEHEGRFLQPILTRFIVRLWDNSIAYKSAPVIVGAGIQGANECTFEVVSSGGRFSGVNSVNYAVNTYGLAMTAIKGTSTQLDSLIKSIEVYYAKIDDPIDASRIEYKCQATQSGTKKQYLIASLARKGDTEVRESLASARDWKLIARINDLSALRNGIIKSAGTRKCISITGGTLSGNTYIAYNYGQFTATDDGSSTWLNNSTYMPQCFTSHNGNLFAAGGREKLLNRWKLINSMLSEFTNDYATMYTALTIRSINGERKVVTTESCNVSSLKFSTLLAFPFADAIKVEIAIKRNSKVYKIEQELSSSNDNTYSYYISPDLSPIEATEVSSTSYTVPAEINAVESTKTRLMIYAQRNPLVAEISKDVGDGEIHAIAFAMRPVSVNIFGKFPLYLFSEDGIYAVSTDSSNAEPRRLDNKQIKSQSSTAQTPYGIMAATQDKLYMIDGSKITMKAINVDCAAMCWNSATEELWCVDSNGSTRVYNIGGRYYSREESISNITENVIVDNRQRVYDIIGENGTQQTYFYYLSHPINIEAKPRQITWNIFGENLNINLIIRGENGNSCHGELITMLHVKGNVNSPIHVKLPKLKKYRTIRAEIEGRADFNTLLYPIEISNEM